MELPWYVFVSPELMGTGSVSELADESADIAPEGEHLPELWLHDKRSGGWVLRPVVAKQPRRGPLGFAR